MNGTQCDSTRHTILQATMDNNENTQHESAAQMAGKSWHGRLSGIPDGQTAALLSSLDVDIDLWKYDIAGSKAHARMLSEEGIISAEEFAVIEKGLEDIAGDIEAGRLTIDNSLEDIHMVIEAALIERTGPAGAKLHTGRSRNDQVALDLKLWSRDAAADLVGAIRTLQQAFVTLAERSGRTIIPAYTHLQRAQPIAAGHLLLSYVEMLQRDAGRLTDASKRADACPLGAGAVGGTSLPLNRDRIAALTGFSSVSRNSIDATSDRDFLVELCFACAMLGVHLSRWCEDWIIFSSCEFGLIELDDAYCTSSSMMPQKKNPDTLELIRAKSAAVISDLVGMLVLMKGLPSGYNRDLQDDKRFAFGARRVMRRSLGVAAGIVATTRLRAPDLKDGYLDATSLAEYLTSRGIPFREAHGIVGRIVARAEKNGCLLRDIPSGELENLCGIACPGIENVLGAENVVAAYASPGAGGTGQLAEQIACWKTELDMM